MNDRALCKYKGMLVIANMNKSENGRCPECYATEFYEHEGWMECECGFAILKTDYNRITQQEINNES